jgi:hypothetical protein
MIIQTWVYGPKGGWKLGVKDLAYIDRPRWNSRSVAVSFFGKRRKPDDGIRVGLIWAGLKAGLTPYVKIDIKSLYPLLLRVSRHREVETLKFTLFRNIVAIVLLLIMMTQSARLFCSVWSQPYGFQEAWDHLQTIVNETRPTLFFSQ